MRALLARYSPSGHAIVTAYEALPTRFELPEGPYTVSSSDGFDGYFRDGAVENVATYMDTGVHEMTHGYAGRMAFQLLAERGLPFDEGAVALPIDGQPWLVRFTATYPAIEMDATFPTDARTFLYGAYVNRDEPNLATQAYGVYGLLEELAAFYQGSRTTVDFWPWVRDEAPADGRVALNYAVALDATLAPHAEFELFILHWLLHARDHHPEIHAAVMANDEFRRAFAAVDEAYGALVASVNELEPAVHEFARSCGVEVERRDGRLVIGGNPQRPEEAAPLRAVHAHLQEESYRSILAALHGSSPLALAGP
jgi:hypothetical protein